jgi:CHAD domain-containing protein
LGAADAFAETQRRRDRWQTVPVTALGLQLLLPAGLSASAVADALAAEVPIITQKAHTIDRSFWDTFDGRVHDAGLALVDAGGRLAVTDPTTYAEHAGETRKRGSTRLLAGDLPPGALRERLEPLIEMRAITPIARVRSRMLPLNVLDDVGKIVVRLRVEESTAVVGDRDDVVLPPRLHVIGVRGYDLELDELRALLSNGLGLVEAARPMHHDAVEAAGGAVGGTSSKLRLELRAEQRADVAAVTILRRLLEVVELNLPGTLENADSEFLHDLRVAVRRTRALQRELRTVFAREPLRVFRDGFRELQRVTGPTRDLDVQLLDFDALAAGLPDAVAGDVAPLHRLLEDHRVVERRTMVRILKSERTRGLLDNWSQYLDRLAAAGAPAGSDGGEGSGAAAGPDAALAVGDVAGRRIARVYRRMVKMGAAIDDDTPAEALHELRKQGKELRYLLEFFSSLYPAAVVKPMVSSLKGLQDVLGRFQDREVQADLLRSLGDEVAVLEGGAAALMAMGVLVQRLTEQQTHARAQFAESFAGFAAKSQRKLVEQTFGCRG